MKFEEFCDFADLQCEGVREALNSKPFSPAGTNGLSPELKEYILSLGDEPTFRTEMDKIGKDVDSMFSEMNKDI